MRSLSDPRQKVQLSHIEQLLRTKPKLATTYDLNNHLFAQLERLADEELTPEKIDQEAKRGEAMVAVADRRAAPRSTLPSVRAGSARRTSMS